jgi:hypothetical protein
MKNGINLFRIPQVPNRISPEKLIPFVVKRAQKRGIQIPKGWENLKIDFNKVYHGHGKERIEYCKKLADKHNGKFISNEWKGEEHKYTWMCEKDHEWQTKVRIIEDGNWCKYCSGKAKLTIELFQNIAKERGGECLSERYVSRKGKLRFRCKEGHEFVSTAGNIKVGRWCAICAGKMKHTLKEMQELAKLRNGKCLSKVYKNNKSKLLWECEKGHRWETTPKKVLIGQWCTICKKRKFLLPY